MASNFGENLRSELNFQDITVKELSSRTGIPVATLDCYLGTRATIPSVEAAYKIAQALQVSVEYLVIGEKANIASNSKRKTKQEARDIIKWIGSLNREQSCAIVNLVSAFNKHKKKPNSDAL